MHFVSTWIAKETPPFLYKYCSASRAEQIMRDLQFYFTPTEKLNDLYEFNVLSLFTEDPESKYRVSAKRLMAEGWSDDFAEALDLAKTTLSADDVASGYSFFMEQLQPKLLAVRKHSGVTCFSSERNNQRMWGTYGDSHAGAVIEFSTSPKLSRFAKHLMSVIYTDSKLPICPSELMTEKGTLNQQMLTLFLGVKHIHWRDEMEWRLLLLADAPQRAEDRVASFERSALTRVFIGPRISPEQEGTLRATAARHEMPVPVFKRQVDEQFAKEEYFGMEQIHSLDQMLYWAHIAPKQS
jgi:hypothetical protein